MDLKNRISVKRPRETSGSSSANRFDYQKDWAILQLLELHKSNQNYLLVLDYYDDVVIFDCEQNPTKMDFFQIKTSGTNWSLSKLLYRKKGKNGPLPSIIGKMYDCKVHFPDHTVSLNFISNSPFSLTLKDKKTNSTTKKQIALSEVCDKKLVDIINQVKEEHLLTDDPELVEITYFKVSDLTINEREHYVKGKLSDFLEELNPNGTFKLSLVYNSLFDEVKRKNNYEGEISGFDELSKHKGISRSYFTSVIKNFTGDDVDKKTWSMIENRLNLEGVSMLEIFELQTAWDTYRIDKMDLTNQYLQSIRSTINSIIQPYRLNKSLSNLYHDIICVAYKDFITSNNEDLYGEYYIKVIILREYLNA